MKKVFTRSSVLVLIFFAVSASAQSGAKQRSMDSIAINKCILDYIEGYYEMNPARAGQSAHKQLVKTNVIKFPNADTFRLSSMTYASLIDHAATFNKSGRYNQHSKKDITIYDIGKKTASARLAAEGWVDYLQIGKLDGNWKIINILFEVDAMPPDEMSSDAKVSAIRQCVLDYIEGLYEVNPERVGRSAHTRLAKRSISKFPGSDTSILSPVTHADLVKLAATFNSTGKYTRTAKKEMIIYEVGKRIASVKLVAQGWIDHIHLCNINGKWKIVNILWE